MNKRTHAHDAAGDLPQPHSPSVRELDAELVVEGPEVGVSAVPDQRGLADSGDDAPTDAEIQLLNEESAARLMALWQDYKATADSGLRDQLILHYSPLVKYVAGRVGVGHGRSGRRPATSNAHTPLLRRSSSDRPASRKSPLSWTFPSKACARSSAKCRSSTWSLSTNFCTLVASVGTRQHSVTHWLTPKPTIQCRYSRVRRPATSLPIRLQRSQIARRSS